MARIGSTPTISAAPIPNRIAARRPTTQVGMNPTMDFNRILRLTVQIDPTTNTTIKKSLQPPSIPISTMQEMALSGSQLKV